MLLSMFLSFHLARKVSNINPDIVDDFISEYIMGMWTKFKPYILSWRENQNRPASYEHFEYLYNQIKPIYEDQHGSLGEV